MRATADFATNDEWHILKAETQYGPYTYEEMIRLMQQNLIFSFDYAWAPHLESWTALADLQEFSTDRLANLAEKNISGFHQRQHERVLCKLPVYVNDQQTLWEGQVENLSERGALIIMKNPALLPGNVVQIHFRSRTDQDLAFNCKAEVLTKRLVKQRIQHNTGIHYAVKFMEISNLGEKQIESFIMEFKTNAETPIESKRDHKQGAENE